MFCPNAVANRSAAASFVVRAMRRIPPPPEPKEFVKRVRILGARFA
jgi:hypothetical protein